MQKLFTRCLIGLFAGSLVSCASTPAGVPDPDQRFATVITYVIPRDRDIHPLSLTSIDGQRVTDTLNIPESTRRPFRLSPGEHRIDGSLLPKNYYPTGLKPTKKNILPLVANFESGRRYYLAVERSKTDRGDWEVVIWKIEDSEQGLLTTN